MVQIAYDNPVMDNKQNSSSNVIVVQSNMTLPMKKTICFPEFMQLQWKIVIELFNIHSAKFLHQ